MTAGFDTDHDSAVFQTFFIHCRAFFGNSRAYQRTDDTTSKPACTCASQTGSDGTGNHQTQTGQRDGRTDGRDGTDDGSGGTANGRTYAGTFHRLITQVRTIVVVY